MNQKLQSQPARDAQRTWATVTRTTAQTAAGWATVSTRKKKPKKHPLDQRRILLLRSGHKDIMFEVNKALAHARAYVTVRLVKMKYIEKGNLSFSG